jgi:hypothetical protein
MLNIKRHVRVSGPLQRSENHSVYMRRAEATRAGKTLVVVSFGAQSFPRKRESTRRQWRYGFVQVRLAWNCSALMSLTSHWIPPALRDGNDCLHTRERKISLRRCALPFNSAFLMRRNWRAASTNPKPTQRSRRSLSRHCPTFRSHPGVGVIWDGIPFETPMSRK